jgi:hypothetical protein
MQTVEYDEHDENNMFSHEKGGGCKTICLLMRSGEL